MAQSTFPPLPLADWRPTRDTIQTYAQVLGQVRRALAPPQKHWWHISLHTTATGLTTGTIPAGDQVFDMTLDCTAHTLTISTSKGERLQMDLRGQSPKEFCETALAALDAIGVRPDIDQSKFASETPGTYDKQAVETFWQALTQVDAVLKQFKGELRQETGPVQLWPHHFDLALLWFSGRLVPGEDPADEESADEQMNFGFSTGDEGIPDPYFYATAYPWPDGITEADLPAGASWHTEGWRGGLLMYEVLLAQENPKEYLLSFLRAAHEAGSGRMR